MRARPRSAALAALLAVACAAGPRPEPADLVLTGGRVVTLDDELPEARAVAVRDGRIALVGTERQVGRLVGPSTHVLELDGALVIPGFVEGHGHFLGIGDMKLQLDLTRVRSYDELVATVAHAASEARPGELVRGRGWHQSKWESLPEDAVQGLPTHAALSAVSERNPVVLRHASGHAAMANALAMRLSGIDRDTPDPRGGEIVRDAAGEPIGIFRETAMDLLAPAYRRGLEPDVRREIRLARDECLAKGITGFHDAGTPLATVALYREAAEAGELGLRMYVMLSDSNEALDRLPRGPLPRPLHPLLRVGGIKRYVDGALGSHGAWLLEPYSDLPKSTGLNTYPIEDLRETARLAVEHGLQLCVHAIGDRANREVLDVFEEAFAAHPELVDPRWRIEHAQHLNPDDIPRFAELGVVASMQAVHCTSDAAFVVDRLGERRAREGAYVWRELLDRGVLVTNGTDAPVEDVDPIANFHSAVTRLADTGERFWPDQCMTRMEALRAATLSNAEASFSEAECGSLEPGKWADMTVLSRDILSVPEEEILGTQVLATIVGGEVEWIREELATRRSPAPPGPPAATGPRRSP